MNIKKIFILIFFCLVLLNINIVFAAGNAGKNSAAFLKIPIGGRATGMAGAYTSVANDIYAVYYNPAGLAEIKKMSIGFQHNSWLLDINQEFIGLAVKLPRENVLALSASILDAGSEIRTIETPSGAYGGSNGTWTATDMSIGLSWARRVNNSLSYGITGKMIKQEIAGYSADAMALDFGVLTSFIEEDFKVGASIQNVGTQLKFIEKQENLPIIYRVGASYKLPDMIFSADIVKPSDNDLSLRFGVEYFIANNLAVRAGWNSDDDLSSSGLAAGIGMKINRIKLDYSFEPKDNFGDVHRFSMNYDF